MFEDDGVDAWSDNRRTKIRNADVLRVGLGGLALRSIVEDVDVDGDGMDVLRGRSVLSEAVGSASAPMRTNLV